MEDTVRGLGTVLEQMGKSIVFVSSHPIMAQGGLVGLLFFGGRKALVLASVGAALDEITKVVFGSITVFGKAAERVVRLEEELARLKRSTSSTNAEILAIQAQLVLAERTLDNMTVRTVEGTTALGEFGQGFITAGQDLQKFTLVVKEGAGLVADGVRTGIVDPVISELSTIEDAGRNAGESLIRGFIQGTDNLGALLLSVIKQIATTLIIGEFNKALGNQSPSKAAALAGRNTVLGYIKGLQDAATAIPSAVGGAFALAAPAGAASGAGAGGGTVVHQNIEFKITVMDARSVRQVLQEQSGTIAEIVGDAAQAGRGFRRMLRGR